MTSYVSERKPEVVAYDTETFKGDCMLLCSNSRFLFNNFKPIPTVAALDFIYQQSSRGKKLSFFFNLSFDAAAVLKEGLTNMSEVELQKFRKTKEASFGRYDINYLINKSICIKDRVDKRSVKCYDIAGLMHDKSGKGSLEALAEKHLGKVKVKAVDSARLNIDLQYWADNLATIIEYCMKDAELTRELAEKLIEYCYNTLEFYPSQFYSKASISKGWLERYHGNLQKLFMHTEFNCRLHEVRWGSRLGLKVDDLEFINNTYWGGVFDTTTFGFVENVSEIDINSAYPHATTMLPKLENLSFERDGSYDPSAVTGFYKIKMRYTDYPMPYREKFVIAYPQETDEEGELLQEQILYPETESKHVHYTTKPKLDFFRSRGIKFTVLESLQFYGKYEPEFHDMHELYNRRLNFKGRIERCSEDDLKTRRELEFRQYLLKIVMNACFSPDTDVMTTKGIKNIKDMQIGDRVYSINPETLEVERDTVTAVQAKEFAGSLIHFHCGRQLDLQVTPDHKFLVQRNHENPKMLSAEEIIKKTNYRIPSAKTKLSGNPNQRFSWEPFIPLKLYNVYLPNTPYCTKAKQHQDSYNHQLWKILKDKGKYNPYLKRFELTSLPITLRSRLQLLGAKITVSERGKNKLICKSEIELSSKLIDVADLLGWIISEGNASHCSSRFYSNKHVRGDCYRIDISQSQGAGNPRGSAYRDEIRKLLLRLPFRYSESTKGFRICNRALYRLCVQETGKLAANKHIPPFLFQQNALVRWKLFFSLMKGDGSYNRNLYSTVSRKLAEDFSQLCISLGFSVHFHLDTIDRIYRIWFTNKSEFLTKAGKNKLKKIEKIPYYGAVYCITTAKNHTIFAGRNGTFKLTGQCYGTMAQLRNGHGSFTNLIYASLITSMTHVQIYELLEKIGFDNVVFIATDGIMYKEHNQQFKIGDKMGECKKEFENATAHIYQNGVYYIEKDGKIIEFRKRGMPTLTVDMLKEAKGETLSLSWSKPYRMIQALVSSDDCVSNVKKIGQWLPHDYTLDLKDVCRKRQVAWPLTFERFNNEEVPSIPIMDLDKPSELRCFPQPKLNRRH